MLDEIGDMSPICRPSSCGCYRTACSAGSGTSREVRVNVRFICTTQKQLLDLGARGQVPGRPLLPPQRAGASACRRCASARRTSWPWPSSSSPASPASCSAPPALYPQHGRIPDRLPLARQRASCVTASTVPLTLLEGDELGPSTWICRWRRMPCRSSTSGSRGWTRR